MSVASDVRGIKRLSMGDWTREASGVLVSAVAKHVQVKGRCSVMLTGGRAAAALYKVWGNHPRFQNAQGVDYYFGDERCVPTESVDSNYGMAMRTLFAKGVPEGCTLHRMEGEHAVPAEAADHYASCLPSRIDILLLSLGEDGHIASLFPDSPALNEWQKRVVAIVGPKSPCARLTITPRVIRDAKEIFVLSIGADKRKVLEMLTKDLNDYTSIPARLAICGEWITEKISDRETI